MSEIPRDLASIELWRDSLERSLRRRALAPIARKREARLKRTSLVAGAAVATAPLFPSLGAATAASAPRKSDDPHSRRLEDAAKQRILLRRGDESPAVGELQRALEIRVDDIFGRQTEAAVRTVQARAGLPVTGRVDVQTWLTLFPNDAVIALTGPTPRGAGHNSRPAQQWAAVTVPPTAAQPDSLATAGQARRSASRPFTGAATAPAATNVVTTESNATAGGVRAVLRLSHPQTTAAPDTAAPRSPAPLATLPRVPSPAAAPPAPASIPAPGSTGGQPIQIQAPTPASSQTATDLIAEMIAAADAIDARHYAYRWGGGHNASFSGPYDCSGAVSAVLHAAGLLSGPHVSGDFMQWGAPGPGAVTIYANASHVYMAIEGRFFGTSRANPGGGAGWYQGSARPGFVVVHVPFERMHLRPSAARVQAARARQHQRRQRAATAATQASRAGGLRSTAASKSVSAPSGVATAAASGRATSAGGSRPPAAHPAETAAVPITVAPSAGPSAGLAPSSTPISGAVAEPESSVSSPTAAAPSSSVEASAPTSPAPTTATSEPSGAVDSGSPAAVASPAPTEPAAAPAAPASADPTVAEPDTGAPIAADPAPPNDATGPVAPDPSSAPADPASTDVGAPASAPDPSDPAAEPASATGEVSGDPGEVSGDAGAVTPSPPEAPSSSSASESATDGSASQADEPATAVSAAP